MYVKSYTERPLTKTFCSIFLPFPCRYSSSVKMSTSMFSIDMKYYAFYPSQSVCNFCRANLNSGSDICSMFNLVYRKNAKAFSSSPSFPFFLFSAISSSIDSYISAL